MFSCLSLQELGVRTTLEDISYLETGRAGAWHIGKEGPILAVLWAPWVPNHDLGGGAYTALPCAGAPK